MRRVLAALLAAATLAVAACGSGDDNGNDTPAAGTTTSAATTTAVSPETAATSATAPATSPAATSAAATADAAKVDNVTVGVIPILDVAPIYLGQAKGFFKEKNIELKLELAQGGAAITPAVISGQFHFGFSNVTSLLIARSKDLPLVVVSPGASSTGQVGKDFGALVVRKGSDLKDAAGLSGKKVAVNTLNNICDTVVRRAVSAAGGDDTKIQFVELPFPDMPAALDRGDVEGACIVEPFLTLTLDTGSRIVSSMYAEAHPKLPVAVYFTTEKMRTENPDLVARFSDAMKRSQAYAEENPDEARQILTTYTKIDPAIIEKVIMPSFPAEVDRAGLEALAALVQKSGLISKDPDLDALMGS